MAILKLAAIMRFISSPPSVKLTRLKYAGEPTRVEIGDRNRIRESVTIHRGTVQGGGLTKVGSDNLLMINAHIAHDCTVGNRCILANNATLAGHVSVDDFAIIGGMTAVHQFCIIGAHVMVGGCSGVAQDVLLMSLRRVTTQRRSVSISKG